MFEYIQLVKHCSSPLRVGPVLEIGEVIFAALPQSSMLHHRRLLFLLWSMNMNRAQRVAGLDAVRLGPWVSSSTAAATG